jgi:tetratricopeptide (TPR) repeat protein
MAISEHERIQRELKQPDPFFEAIEEAREYYQKNRSQVLAVGGGVVAVFLVVTAATNYWISQGNRAASDFSSAVAGLQFDSPAAAEAALKNIAGLSHAGPYKALASLYQGNLAAEAGHAEEAVALYDQFLAEAPTDYLKQIGLMGKAAAQEKAGKPAEAAATLDQASAIDGPYRQAALSDRARLATDAGDKSTAIANLQKLLEIVGSSGDSTDIERRIQALK